MALLKIKQYVPKFDYNITKWVPGDDILVSTDHVIKLEQKENNLTWVWLSGPGNFMTDEAGARKIKNEVGVR